MNKSRFFIRGVLEIEHKVLELLGHSVESGSQFTYFGAALSCTRCEKSPRAMARLDSVRISSGFVIRWRRKC